MEAVKVIHLRIKAASELVGDEEVLMDEVEMRRFPEEAMQQLRLRAEKLLLDHPLKRLTYQDDDGDDCTLTQSSLNDALTFAVACDGVAMLEIKAFVDDVVAPKASMEVAPTADVEQQVVATGSERNHPVSGDFAGTTAENMPEEVFLVVDSDSKIEVHLQSACDGCNQSPILGKRFRCLECQDYDLCERCYKKNRSDGCVHSHGTWAQMASSTSIQRNVPGPVDVVIADSAASSEYNAASAELAGQRALQALAASLNEPLCAAALKALSGHEDERIRAAVASVMGSATGKSGVEAVPPLMDATPAAAVPADVLAVEKVPKAEKASRDADAMVAVQDVVAQYSASVLEAEPMVLGVEATEEASARGDVTEEFRDALRGFGLQQAYRLGRAVLPTSGSTGLVPAEAKAVVTNDGSIPWPESTTIAIAAGEAFGLPSMPLGALQPGDAAEIIFDLNLPLKQEPGKVHSIWTLTNTATGEPFGPLFILEVLWMQPASAGNA